MMLNKLLPELPVIEESAPKPVRRSLAALPDPEPLPPELVDIEKARAVAEHSGFGQSHSTPKSRTPAAKPAPAPVVAERIVPDTGRMVRRSKQTELMSTRVQPETLKFLRDYANENDITFAAAVETIVRDFRKARGL
jgi:hypothetical protein